MEEQLHELSNSTFYWVVSFEHKADPNTVTTHLCVCRESNPHNRFVYRITVLTELQPFRSSRSVSIIKKAPRSFETPGNARPTTAWSSVQSVLVAISATPLSDGMRPHYEWSHTATHSYVCMAYDPPKSGGHYMYHQFNIQQFYVLPTHCICVSCGSENKQRLFPYTALTDWFL